MLTQMINIWLHLKLAIKVNMITENKYCHRHVNNELYQLENVHDLKQNDS